MRTVSLVMGLYVPASVTAELPTPNEKKPAINILNLMYIHCIQHMHFWLCFFSIHFIFRFVPNLKVCMHALQIWYFVSVRIVCTECGVAVEHFLCALLNVLRLRVRVRRGGMLGTMKLHRTLIMTKLNYFKFLYCLCCALVPAADSWHIPLWIPLVCFVLFLYEIVFNYSHDCINRGVCACACV